MTRLVQTNIDRFLQYKNHLHTHLGKQEVE